ncbi:hypothetical protein DAPPUDRAFT_112082 [Daphnia pulex]|uniref:Uncharacterized protein n=1 Tax=Daphnia pulex TaxID=6669 RepID=E9HAX2_DAPPU|nr:hypothetical protein DAPPUDRAFT_112082 [Daphnia pulex]|eukprot:EFX71146.1 hypothetical protein DAPPUDRAFT_112082 [Daphnia pulex]
MPYAPRAHLMPLFYSDGQPAADIEALPEIKDIDNHPKIEPSIEHDQEQKILLTLPSALTNFKPFTTTTTITSTSVVVVSTPTTVKCIPTAQFSTVVAANAAAAPPVAATLATTACSRRRRDLEQLLDGSDLTKEAIQPAQPLALEVTVVDILPEGKEASFAEPEIESSKTANLSADPVEVSSDQEDRGLINLSLTSTVSVTSVTTVYSFAGATIKATATVAAAGQLLCLPSGYAIC